jgi:transposase
VPGRKTDVKDAQWIAELLAHGLVRPSFIPPREQRDLRDLTRYRVSFVRERATLVNRVQKLLEGANLKLGSVLTNVMGVSGRAILRAQLAQALQGQLRPHQSFVLAELLTQIDTLEDTITRFDVQIQAACAAAADEAVVVALLDTIPGVAVTTAQILVAEIGTDMDHFPSAKHLASWAGREQERQQAISTLRSALGLPPDAG